MSPEQVTAKRMGIDHRSDVFSLGIVLYELLALRRPFEGDTSHQVAAQIVTKDPPDIRTIRSRVPRDLAVIAGKALEKDRDKRFPTMEELAADLRRHLANESIHATPPTRLDRVVKWTRRNPAKSAAAAIVVVTFTVIACLLFANVRANRALSAKTVESEERRVAAEDAAQREKAAAELARSNEQRATTEKERADREAEAATRKADEVLRLSALQKLDDLTAEADRLWPAVPENLPKYEEWLRKAGELVAELPDHETKLSELRAKSVPWTEEEQARQRAEHPKLAELESAQRHIEHHRKLRAALESSAPASDPRPEEVGVDLGSLPGDANGVNGLAWDLIDPERKEWGGEGNGLVLARRAVELAADLPPEERAGIRDSLAWALFANGRFDEAVAEEEQALEEAGADKKQEFEGYIAKLKEKIEEEIDPEKAADREKHVTEITARIGELEAEVSRRPEWLFADAQDKWWHNQLEKLVSGLEAFSDPESGLASSGSSAEHGWGIGKRAEFARTIAARSLSGSEASAQWAEAIASIADVSECPSYGGLRITPQLGLLPIGRDPDSGLWEFAHLQTGEPAQRNADGKLILKESTGLVFVLLPGGTFTMGAQGSDPDGRNYDPEADSDEGPPREVRMPAFFVSKYEMTQGQWLHFTGVNPSRDNPQTYGRSWNKEGEPGDLLHPVEQVSWLDCTAVLERLGLELPREAQWEYGARAGTTTAWWCGNEKAAIANAGNLADRYAKDNGGSGWGAWEDWNDGNLSHARVGSYLPNGFGLHDVIGNVWEWCQDLHGTGAANRVFRGGGFTNLAVNARSASRYNVTPSYAVVYLGLRPARALLAP
jgi:formylglycine-generating enzyme required for sulfatase activity